MASAPTMERRTLTRSVRESATTKGSAAIKARTLILICSARKLPTPSCKLFSRHESVTCCRRKLRAANRRRERDNVDYWKTKRKTKNDLQRGVDTYFAMHVQVIEDKDIENMHKFWVRKRWRQAVKKLLHWQQAPLVLLNIQLRVKARHYIDHNI